MTTTAVTSRRAPEVAARIRFSGLYAQAESFYTRQLALAESGGAAGLAATFAPGTAPDGWDAGPGHRFWIGKLEIDPENEHTLRTRCSIFSRPVAPGPGGLRVTVVEDVLTRFGDDWLATDRRVLRDTAL
ncbi:hypothetical protein N4P33_33285 [Streptomyces sp. 15-116A]|uniref:hypothetical protein n=1 Tax=Streptomyces sp. 15-116A TaxID=2259035 RepID=UPI0021B4657E|nr:hypothetical protein [Streptomyces sp. 15-116A]MCT7356979.1 hypothetical protein [Streptomyces sp. 15-116A]